MRFAEFDSTEYEEMILLRHNILRKPLGLNFTSEQLDAEKDSHHLGAYLGEELVGCLILKPIDKKTLKMRQVCVSEVEQKSGVGAAMCDHSEYFAVENGFTKIFCHARAVVSDFYKKIGYSVVGEPFEEVGLEHFRMEKDL